MKLSPPYEDENDASRSEDRMTLLLGLGDALDQAETFEELIDGARNLLTRAFSADVVRLLLTKEAIDGESAFDIKKSTDRIDAERKEKDPLQTIFAEDIEAEPELRSSLASLRAEGAKSAASLSILRRGECFGDLLLLFRRSRRFSEVEILEMKMAASIIADRIDNLRLRSEMRRSKRSRDRFLTIVSHELSNPLAPMMNALYLLKLRGSDPETLNKCIEAMDRQVHALVRLIETMRDFSRLDRGKLEIRFRRFNLTKLASDFARDRIRAMDNKVILFTADIPDDPIFVECDSDRLSQCLDIIIRFAIKRASMSEEKKVKLTIGANEGFASVRFIDSGPRYDREDLDAVFDESRQEEEDSDRGLNYLDLELAVVKRLMKLQKGEVVARNDRSVEGSEIVLKLPLAV